MILYKDRKHILRYIAIIFIAAVLILWIVCVVDVNRRFPKAEEELYSVGEWIEESGFEIKVNSLELISLEEASEKYGVNLQNDMKKIVAIVPMKLNNQRLPQKNTKAFTNGKPLCYYILSTLLKIEKIDDVYVYCSNEEIKKYIPSGVKYLKRSESLDQNTTKMNEILKAFAKDVPADIYVMTHTTAPFISKESIEKGLDAVLSGEYDSSFAAKKLQDFLWKDGKPFNYELDNIPRTQDLEPLYEETSGFYIYNSSVITSLNRRIGEKPYIVEVNEIEAVDIDEKEDFQIADAIYNSLYKIEE